MGEVKDWLSRAKLGKFELDFTSDFPMKVQTDKKLRLAFHYLFVLLLIVPLALINTDFIVNPELHSGLLWALPLARRQKHQ